MRFVENLETPVSEMMTDTNLAIVNEPVITKKHDQFCLNAE